VRVSGTAGYVGENGAQDDFFFHAVFVAIIDLETGTVTHETTHFSTECR
jgi:hypothetical protein